MRKFHLLLTIAISALCLSAQTSTTESDFTFCLYIDNPDVCYLQDNEYNPVKLEKGENVFTGKYRRTIYTDGSIYESYDSFVLYINSDLTSEYKIAGCEIDYLGVRTPYAGYSSPTTGLSLTTHLSGGMDGFTIYPVIAHVDDLRTATATVTIDDASKVRIRSGSYTPVLQNGSQVIKFDPVNECYWTIGAASYGQYLGSVTHNGVLQEENNGAFSLNVADGDKIDITAIVESVSCPVSLTFTNPDTNGAVTGVYTFINYVKNPIEGWQNGFEVENNTQIIVSLNRTDYNISSLSANGVSQTVYSDDIYLTIRKPTTIGIDATPYGTFPISLSLTDPSSVVISVAESQYAQTFPIEGLIAGTQTVNLSGKMTYMVINPVSGSIIETVAYTPAGGSMQEVELSYGGYYIPIAEGTAVTVNSHMKARDARATLWIKDITKAHSLYLRFADGNDVVNTYGNTGTPRPVSGNQTFSFDPATDNPFYLYYVPTNYDVPGYVLLNGVKLNPLYEDGTQYEITLNAGDILKVYPGESYPPAQEIVTGDVDGDGEVTVTDISVIIDILLSGEYVEAADLDGDGEITITDISAIVDIILY